MRADDGRIGFEGFAEMFTRDGAMSCSYGLGGRSSPPKKNGWRHGNTARVEAAADAAILAGWHARAFAAEAPEECRRT